MSQYSLWLLERPPFSFPLLSTPSHNAGKQSQKYDVGPFDLPSREDWTNIWSVWDFVTRRMIPPSMLYQKPIDLRHICLFYLGHIPTFLDIHLSNLLQEVSTEPTEFKASYPPLEMRWQLTLDNRIFLRLVSSDDLSRTETNLNQRGIDPDVDDPTQCHVGTNSFIQCSMSNFSFSHTLKYQTTIMPGPA